MKKLLLLLAISLSISATAQNQLYKVTLLRAKPGELLPLIDLIKTDIAKSDELISNTPYLLRHSQGDHWDLMLIYPIQELSSYFSTLEINKRSQSATIEKPYGDQLFDLVSFQEEAIVQGPEPARFEENLQSYNLFHIEIFTALAGKQNALLKQRKDENSYYKGIDHRPNFIFTRVFGASWDSFTVGCYTDLHDFAGPKLTFEQEDKAAKDAGFRGVNYIGSYLRSLLFTHHDTFAYKIN